MYVKGQVGCFSSSPGVFIHLFGLFVVKEKVVLFTRLNQLCNLNPFGCFFAVSHQPKDHCIVRRFYYSVGWVDRGGIMGEKRELRTQPCGVPESKERAKSSCLHAPPSSAHI